MQDDLTEFIDFIDPDFKNNLVLIEKLQISNEKPNLNYDDFCAILFQRNPNSLKKGFFHGCIISNEEKTLIMDCKSQANKIHVEITLPEIPHRHPKHALASLQKVHAGTRQEI